MEIEYNEIKTEKICHDIKLVTKYFGGDRNMAISLLARINALELADTIKDIIVQRPMRFHNLCNKGKGKNLKGYFAIDVKTSRDKWRIILQPLNDNGLPFDPCNIDEIASRVKIIKIREVSEHYE